MSWPLDSIVRYMNSVNFPTNSSVIPILIFLSSNLKCSLFLPNSQTKHFPEFLTIPKVLYASSFQSS